MSDCAEEKAPSDQASSGRERYKRLPDAIPIADTVASHVPLPAPDPTMGRDPDRDFMLGNAAG
jgi:hypothetical protein